MHALKKNYKCIKHFMLYDTLIRTCAAEHEHTDGKKPTLSDNSNHTHTQDLLAYFCSSPFDYEAKRHTLRVDDRKMCVLYTQVESRCWEKSNRNHRNTTLANIKIKVSQCRLNIYIENRWSEARYRNVIFMIFNALSILILCHLW